MIHKFEPLDESEKIFEDENVIIFTPKSLSRCKYYCSILPGARCYGKNGYAHWRGVHGTTVYFIKHKTIKTVFKNHEIDTNYMVDVPVPGIIHPLRKIEWVYSFYLLFEGNEEWSYDQAKKISPFLENYMQYLKPIKVTESEKKELRLLHNMIAGFFSFDNDRLIRFFNSLEDKMKNEVIEAAKYSSILQKHIPLLFLNVSDEYKKQIIKCGLPLDENIIKKFTHTQILEYQNALNNAPKYLIVV